MRAASAHLPAATLSQPQGVSIDATGTNLVIADSGNNRIRTMGLSANTNTISSIAGNGIAGFSGDGDVAATALVNNPARIFVNAGALVFADTNNNRIRRIVTAIDIDPTLLSFAAKLDFSADKKTGDLSFNKDAVSVKAGLALPKGISLPNLPIAIDIVDLHQSTQLDAKGKQPSVKAAKPPKAVKHTSGTAKTPKGVTVAPGFSFTLSSGEIPPVSKFSLSLKGTSPGGGKPTPFSFASKGTFREELGRAGFSDVTTPKDGVSITLRIDITLGTTVFTGTTAVNYKAAQEKGGTAKSGKK